MTRFAARRLFTGISLLALSGAAAPALEAQGTPTTAQPIRYYRGVVGFNPLGIPFDILSIEAEGAVAAGMTVAGAVSHFAPGEEEDDRFTSGDVKFRYYPGETALDGFSVGLGIGITRRSGISYMPENCVIDPGTGQQRCDRNSATGPAISVLADYNFLLGERRRFFVGTGVGAKRWLVGADTRESVDAERAWVFARFLLGMAF